MRIISVKIDERAFEALCQDKKFSEFLEGCVRGPSSCEKIIFTMLDKINSGQSEMEIGLKGEKLQ